MNIIKATANVISLTTANTIYNSTVVYVSTVAAAEITVASNTGTTVGKFVLPPNQYIFVDKLPTHTLASNVAVFATPAAYRG